MTLVSAPFVMSCSSAMWGAGKEEQMGVTIPSPEVSVKHQLLLQVTAFLGHSPSRSCWSHPGSTRSLLWTCPMQRCVRRGGQAWAEWNIRPPWPRIASFFQELRLPCCPHPPHTVKKPWAWVSTSKAVLAAVLEMEPDNFGYEWLVCSSGWNYCWGRRFAGWCHLCVARAESWKKKNQTKKTFLGGALPLWWDHLEEIPCQSSLGFSTDALWKGASCCQCWQWFLCCVYQ